MQVDLKALLHGSAEDFVKGLEPHEAKQLLLILINLLGVFRRTENDTAAQLGFILIERKVHELLDGLEKASPQRITFHGSEPKG